MKYRTKEELLSAIEKEHQAFLDVAESIPTERFDEPGVWGDDWTVKDLFAHLTEWERMFMGWYRQGRAGETPHLPAPGYKWSETPRLNHDIWDRNRDVPWPEIRRSFDASYGEVLALARSLSEEELLRPGRFAWTTKYPLTTYLGPNTASHYRTATKILKRWQRQQAREAKTKASRTSS